jgi:SAM-dependent methyltransferase
VAREWRAERPQGLWRRHGDWVYVRLLGAWLSPRKGQHLLKTDLFDEAVGEGLYPFLAGGGARVVGMDLSVTIVRQAQAQYRDLRALGADVRRLPFADRAFDLVLSNSTLDHFHTRAEIAESLREIFRVLRPGGELLLTLDNPVNPVVTLRNALPFSLLHRMGLVPYYVGATLAPLGLRRALRAAGFEITRTGAMLHCPRSLAVQLSSLLERRGTAAAQERLLRLLRGFEGLERWPTRFLTGYYVAVSARKPASDVPPTGGQAWS